jgi:putative glutamine amidotransferase
MAGWIRPPGHLQLFRPPADYEGMRPLIGVFSSERHHGVLPTLRREEGAPATELRLGTPYLRAVERAGGLPVVIAHEEPRLADALLDRLDGLCLAGGSDIDPAFYMEERRHPLLGATDPAVDAAELALARAADRRGTPILGVCRGAQALNVVRGGSLRQHLDGHRQTAAGDTPAHTVSVREASRLAALTGAATLDVNSFHHQAVDRLGTGLQVAATAPDGTIEAIEDPTRPLVLGVQWHAEGMVERPEQLALFEALVRAAAKPQLALAA